VQICLSHFSRGIYEGRPMDTKGETFFHSQLATSMDIDCWSCLDWVHGGLQFQAIHHLFPRLPRHRLCARSCPSCARSRTSTARTTT
jgi:fatty acid desaturase